jgi:hypothetical protein
VPAPGDAARSVETFSLRENPPTRILDRTLFESTSAFKRALRGQTLPVQRSPRGSLL